MLLLQYFELNVRFPWRYNIYYRYAAERFFIHIVGKEKVFMTINIFLTYNLDYNYNAQVAIARSSNSVSHCRARVFPPEGA